MRRLDGDLLLLGVAGKMGPTLAMRARRAANEAGVTKRIIGVSRFSEPGARKVLEDAGVETVVADLGEPAQITALPDAQNVGCMAGRKFGSSGDASLTWAMNVYVPALKVPAGETSRSAAPSGCQPSTALAGVSA